MRSFCFSLISSAIALTSASAAAEELCRVWQERTYEVPFPRGEGEIVYDSWRDVIVFVGGKWYSDGQTYIKPVETWEWDGKSWTQRTQPGPTPRHGFSLTFDENRGVTILFGGELSADDSASGETWSWDGETWTLLSELGPPPRYRHGAAYDSHRARIVLYGGGGSLTGFDFADTWEWDGTNWARGDVKGSIGPGPRFAPGLVFDQDNHTTVLLGGRCCDPEDYDIWRWNGKSWTLDEARIPFDGQRQFATYDPSRHAIVMYSDYGRIWTFDGTAWSNVRGPIYRTYLDVESTPLTFDSRRNGVIAYGYFGVPVHYEADLLQIDQFGWKVLTTSEPASRYRLAMIYDSRRGEALMFGGASRGAHYLGDTWAWNGTEWLFRSLSGPSPRQAPAMAFDSTRGVTVLFGGRGPQPPDDVTAHCCSLDGTWEWDGDSWHFRDVPGPSRRFGHAMAYDEARDVTLLYGGYFQPYTTYRDQAQLGDTWQWNGEVWSEIAVPGPSPRGGHGMVYDPARGVTVLFGAQNLETAFGDLPRDTWEWDGSQWTQVQADGPHGMPGTMHFDSARGHVVMLARPANGSGDYSEAWQWNGGEWEKLGPTGCPALDESASCFDTGRQTAVLFGGTDAWEYPPQYRNRVYETQIGSAVADCDSDCDVDLLDFAVLQTCVGDMSADAACAQLDVDGSGWVDAADFAELFAIPTGPSEPEN